MLRNLLISLYVLFLACTTFSPPIASAKCPMEKYVLKGTVTLEKTNMPLGDVKVFIFFDEYKYFYPSLSRGENIVFHTDQNGKFIVTAFYQSRERILFFQELSCEGLPEKIEFIFEQNGNVARKILSTDKLLIEKEKDYNVIDISEIKLYWEPESVTPDRPEVSR